MKTRHIVALMMIAFAVVSAAIAGAGYWYLHSLANPSDAEIYRRFSQDRMANHEFLSTLVNDLKKEKYRLQKTYGEFYEKMSLKYKDDVEISKDDNLAEADFKSYSARRAFAKSQWMIVKDSYTSCLNAASRHPEWNMPNLLPFIDDLKMLGIY